MATANQIRLPLIAGMTINTLGIGSSTLALNTAGTFLAFGFMAEQAKTVNSVRVNLSAIAGSLIASDLTCEIQSDSGSNAPSNATIAGGSAQPANASPVAGFIQFDGFIATLTAGTQYWLVLKNANGTPGTNTPTYRWFTSVYSGFAVPTLIANSGTVGGLGTYALTKLQTTNSGTSWGTSASQVAGWTILYSDGTYDGFPISANSPTVTDAKVFNTGAASNEAGIKFTWMNSAANLKAVWVNAANSAGVGPFKVRVYEGSSTSACTLKAESETFAAAQLQTNLGTGIVAHFSSPVVLNPNQTYRVVLADASSTGSSAKYCTPTELTVDSSCPAALMPFDDTLVKTTTTNGASAIGNSPGTAFTDAAIGQLPTMACFLDTNGEFAAQAPVVIPFQQTHLVWTDGDW